jgi:hypothetical protein
MPEWAVLCGCEVRYSSNLNLWIARECTGMRVEVECYAGRKADERRVRFWLDEHEHAVEEVVDQWRGPEHVFCKVRVDDGNLYIIRARLKNPVPEGRFLALKNQAVQSRCGAVNKLIFSSRNLEFNSRPSMLALRSAI